MTKVIEFIGKATVLETADGEYRMELIGPEHCALWSAEDIGKSFNVHIAEVEATMVRESALDAAKEVE